MEVLKVLTQFRNLSLKIRWESKWCGTLLTKSPLEEVALKSFFFKKKKKKTLQIFLGQ